MSRERKYQITIHLPIVLRRAFEAGATASGTTVNQYVSLMATEGLQGRTDDLKALESMSERLSEIQNMMAIYGDKLAALEQSVTALAEGVEQLGERVVALKQGVTGGAVQVIDLPARTM